MQPSFRKILHLQIIIKKGSYPHFSYDFNSKKKLIVYTVINRYNIYKELGYLKE